VKQISDNEIYLIKYIKSVLWRVVKFLSYIEEARCLNLMTLKFLYFLQAVTFNYDSQMHEITLASRI